MTPWTDTAWARMLRVLVVGTHFDPQRARRLPRKEIGGGEEASAAAWRPACASRRERRIRSHIRGRKLDTSSEALSAPDRKGHQGRYDRVELLIEIDLGFNS